VFSDRRNALFSMPLDQHLASVLSKHARPPSGPPGCGPSLCRSLPGRTAVEIVVDEAAGLAWIVNPGCIGLDPHPVRSRDLGNVDELRIDLDPVPVVSWAECAPRRPRSAGFGPAAKPYQAGPA